MRKLLLLLLLLFSAVEVRATDYTATSVAAYLFTEGSGTTVADSSPNTNTGNFASDGHPTWDTTDVPFHVSGSAPNSVNYGANDLINASADASLSFSGNASVCYWLNITTYGGGTENNAIFEKGTNGTFGLIGQYNVQKAILLLVHIDGGAHLHTLASANDSPATGNWFHRADVWDGTNMKIYINGIEDATLNIGSGTLRTDSPCTMNVGNIEGGSRYLNGKLTDFGFFSVDLTSTEINAIYDYGLLGSSGVTSYLMMVD
jgi:hypothetical protein